MKFFTIILFALILNISTFLALIFQNNSSEVQAAIVINDLHAGNGGGGVFFDWTIPPSPHYAAFISIGVNSTNPIANQIAQINTNTGNQYSAATTLSPGTYWAAMYTGLPPNVAILSNITQFAVNFSGQVVAILNIQNNGSNVEISWGSVPASGGGYVLDIWPNGSCGGSIVGGYIPPLYTDFSGGSGSFSGNVGTYGAALVWGVGAIRLSSCTPFTLTSSAPPDSCAGLLDCIQNLGSTSDFGHGSGFIGELVTRILPIILGLAGFASVIVILISSIQFITSSGNPEAAAAARGRLMMALVGFAIIILAFAITQIVDQLFLRTDTLQD